MECLPLSRQGVPSYKATPLWTQIAALWLPLRPARCRSRSRTEALSEVHSTTRFFGPKPARPHGGIPSPSTEQQRGQQVISGHEFKVYKGAVHGTCNSYTDRLRPFCTGVYIVARALLFNAQLYKHLYRKALAYHIHVRGF
jgi:hypothetical protein